MKLTNNSLATIIAWVSTCLLAGGASAMFNDYARGLWLVSGCFGLAAAVGLDIVARARDRTRTEELGLTATNRLERDICYEKEEQIAIAAIRWAVSQLIGRIPTSHRGAQPPRHEGRYPCNLKAEVLVHHCLHQADRGPGFYRCKARITNLSDFGCELQHSEPLPRQRIQMTIWSANRDKFTMLGELLWCSQQANGSFVSGGRFLDALPEDGRCDMTHAPTVEASLIGKN